MEFSPGAALVQLFFAVLFGSGPILAIAAITGLTVAIIQGVTQIQDQTLPQVVKATAVMFSILMFGSMLFAPLINYARHYFELIPVIGR
jgi:type III secretory pathway component EscS